MDSNSVKSMDAGEFNDSVEGSSPREDNPNLLKGELMRAFKVTNNSRTRKVGIMASCMCELEMKCRQKFKLQGELSFVLAEDGTAVDFDYLQMIQTDCMLMVLHGEEHWEDCKPGNSASENVPDNKEKEVMKMVEKLRESKNKRRKFDAKEKFRGMTCITDRSSDSDFELPHISFTRNYRSSTVTEGDFRSTDNNDGLTIVTQPNLQDVPGSSSPSNVVHLPDIEDMPES